MLTCWGCDMMWLAPGPSRSARLHQMFVTPESWPTKKHVRNLGKHLAQNWNSQTLTSQSTSCLLNWYRPLLIGKLSQTVYYLFQEHTINTKETFRRGEVTWFQILLLHTSFIRSTEKYIFSWQCCFRSLRSLGSKRENWAFQSYNLILIRVRFILLHISVCFSSGIIISITYQHYKLNTIVILLLPKFGVSW